MNNSDSELKKLATDPDAKMDLNLQNIVSAGQQLTEKSETKDDSMTNVHFLENAVYKYMSGDRKPIAIRIDSGLYNRFKPLAKRVYGSVCRATEFYIVSFILAVESGVHFSHTAQPINIEKIVIERNLRPRRKLEVVEEEEVTTTRRVKRRSAEVESFDYNNLTLEDLEREYDLAKRARLHGRSMVLSALLKQRRRALNGPV